MSYDGSLSCASCHKLYRFGGADGNAIAVGIDNQTGTRNSPTVWNAVFQTRLFWDGRVGSLEEQAKGPLLNPLEMGMPSFNEVEMRVKRQADYQYLFDHAFGADTEITIDRITDAIAAYERTLITPDSAYDRFVNGDATALSEPQIRGMALFESLGCVTCHSGPNFSDASRFNGLSPWRAFPVYPTPLEKEFSLLDKTKDNDVPVRSAWRVPSLRNVALTGPWLHNGSVTDLHDMVQIMAAAQLGWSGHYLLWSDQKRSLQEINRPLLDQQQIDDVVAFLHALSSDRLIKCKAIIDERVLIDRSHCSE